MSEIRKHPCCMCPAIGENFKTNVCNDCNFVNGYVDYKGNLIYVSSGISEGTSYMTVRGKINSFGTHRVKSKYLPVRDNFTQAQIDLNTYAEIKGWKRVESAKEVKRCVN